MKPNSKQIPYRCLHFSMFCVRIEIFYSLLCVGLPIQSATTPLRFPRALARHGSGLDGTFLGTNLTRSTADYFRAEEEPGPESLIYKKPVTFADLLKTNIISDSPVTIVLASSMILSAIVITLVAVTWKVYPTSEAHASMGGMERARTTNATKVIAICCVIIFSEGFYITQIYPYLSFMAEGLVGGNGGLGFRAGLLQSAPYFGMLVSSYGWGVLANMWGRRKCLLVSLLCNGIVAGSLVGVRQYWLAGALRTLGGLTNCNYPMCYTILKEGLQKCGVDHRAGFVRVAMVFTLSTILGPTVGGLLYDNRYDGGVLMPWTLPFACSSALYICAAISCACLPNDTRERDEESAQARNSLSGWAFFCLMLMGGAMSYVFIGWELGYPLLARVPRSSAGEAWRTDQIAMTFLCGSVGLLLFSNFVYESVVRTLSAIRVWISGFIFASIVIAVFPYLLRILIPSTCARITSNEPCRSPLVIGINCFAQLLVSICVGGNFVTLQLILNDFVSSLACSKQALPIAQSVLQAVNAVVRSTAPLVTGFLFTLTDPVLRTEQVIPFVHLAIVATVCCIGAALAYATLTKNAEDIPERARRDTKESCGL